MSEITGARKNIHQEEVEYLAAVSEATFTKMGGSVNFINNRQHSEKQFFANGRYGIESSYPTLAVDGLTFFQYDAEIIDAWMFVAFAGSGGTTELDIKRATTPGGSFTSIFSTTPKITSAAGNFVWIHVGSAIAGTTAPVLATTLVDAEDALRLDVITAQSGTPITTGLIIHYRPR